MRGQKKNHLYTYTKLEVEDLDQNEKLMDWFYSGSKLLSQSLTNFY